ncbi:hypothetical protein AVEN_26231-1 [Araneus ventricosus]|uniref:Uncharacterized protein n=1 Tax=Araneus ventricosus TaxID=182803 RepID=A0A4Y2ANI9_ARAVE|nr:hypothetical protein AVEN_26231-1 [Araneus ventricosus]
MDAKIGTIYHWIWTAGPKPAEEPHTGWSGFTKNVAEKRLYEKSTVIPLPFVNFQPSNRTSVNTCLCFAVEECRKRQQRCIMTFVQPTFIKAMDIVSQADDTDEMQKTPDTSDLKKFLIWLKQHSPFNQSEELISLASGIVSDDRVNCDSAEELGDNAAKGIAGKRFAEVTLKRKVQVFTLAAMENSKLIDTDPVF